MEMIDVLAGLPWKTIGIAALVVYFVANLFFLLFLICQGIFKGDSSRNIVLGSLLALLIGLPAFSVIWYLDFRDTKREAARERKEGYCDD